MKKIKIIIASLFVIGLLSANFVIVSIDKDSNENLSLTSLLNKALADDPEDPPDPCGGCPSGFKCEDGICVQLEQPTQTSCEAWCWKKFMNVPGHQITCPRNSGGVTNCSGSACTPDPGTC